MVQVTYVSRNVIVQVPTQAIMQTEVFTKTERDFKIPQKNSIKSTMPYERNVSEGVQNVWGKMSRGFNTTWQPLIRICKWQPDLNINNSKLGLCWNAKHCWRTARNKSLHVGSLISITYRVMCPRAKVMLAVIGTEIRQWRVNPLAIRSIVMVIHTRHADNPVNYQISWMWNSCSVFFRHSTFRTFYTRLVYFLIRVLLDNSFIFYI